MWVEVHLVRILQFGSFVWLGLFIHPDWLLVSVKCPLHSISVLSFLWCLLQMHS